MPYTAQQRKLFHAAEGDPAVAREHGMDAGQAADMAAEADKLKKQGEERPAKKAAIDLTHVFYPGRPHG